MMIVLKKGMEFKEELKTSDDIYYLLEPPDNITLRNALEPIIYQFASKILK